MASVPRPAVPPATLLHTAAGLLDQVRARALRWTLRIPGLRRVFLDRAWRLLALFVGFEAIALVWCTVVPVWQLLLGPLLYGYAHLVSSARYLHHGLSADPPHRAIDRRFLPLAALVVLYTVYRVASVPVSGRVASEWANAWLVDSVFLVLATLMAARAVRHRARDVLSAALIVVPLALLLWSEPRRMIAALALGHNFVGFVYWIRMARDRRERQVALGALVGFSALTAVILTGVFDPVRAAVGLDLTSGMGGVSLEDLGRLLDPTAKRSDVPWSAVVTAFALGQSTHYFVWLKALPDQVHDHPVPTSFRQSLRLFERDFGTRLGRGLIWAVGGGFVVWGLLGLDLGRTVYFAFAGFHGLVELAGLGLLRGPVVTSPVAQEAR